MPLPIGHMSNISILEQIINNQKAEEVARLNAIEIVNELFSELSERERDILTRRFGLHGEGYETLENIGSLHSLTRERIRQIESNSIKRLSSLDKLAEYLESLKKVINHLLEEHGGLMERDYLLSALVGFSINGDALRDDERKKQEEIHKNHLDFLISKLLKKDFEEVSSSKFKKSFKLKFQDLEHLEELADELLQKIKEAQKIYKTEELIDFIAQLETYQKHKEKMDAACVLSMSKAVGSDSSSDTQDSVNKNKPLFTILKSSKEIEQNKFGHWGVYNSREIKPKTINDKIYLVLKNYGKPMHFVEIANRINEIGFDSKKANAATVHNELILDGKYILIGRGIYGLKEWGYKEGTVADVIREILETSEQPLSKDEIVDKVLERRQVKKTTITLALMNKASFERVDGKYRLKQNS